MHIEIVAVLSGWVLFGALLGRRFLAPRAPAAHRDRTSLYGMALQALGLALVWSFPRRNASDDALEVVRAVLVVGLLIASLSFTVAALRSLGRQWSLAAQVKEDHRLVVTGPYRWVRHPMYAGVLGLLMVTGLAAGTAVSLCLGLGVYLAGTLVRLQVEERLLRQAFGSPYEDYARRVPALWPRWPGS